MKQSYLLLALSLSTLGLSGCNGNNPFPDLNTFIEQSNQQQIEAAKRKEGLKFAPPKPITFTAANTRSPFIDISLQAKGTSNKPTSPLQAYPVTTLRFVGLIVHNDINFAYILTPDNKVYPVKQGDIIGDRYGKVVSINRNTINVMEENAATGNKAVQRLITLQLKDEH